MAWVVVASCGASWHAVAAWGVASWRECCGEESFGVTYCDVECCGLDVCGVMAGHMFGVLRRDVAMFGGECCCRICCGME